MQEINDCLIRLGYPINDDFNLKASKLQFSAGGHYGIEISSANNLNILNEIFRLGDEYQ